MFNLRMMFPWHLIKRPVSLMLAVGLTFSALGVVTASSAAAAPSADCTVGLYTNPDTGRSRPSISCLVVTQAQARGRADCTLAPDTYTSWVVSYTSSVGGYCLFGARGALMEVRAR
jgi:hypothetical protein